MKRVICVGKLPASGQMKPSEQIMGLFNEQRVFNTNREIKGVFLVYKQIVLQVFEAENQALAEAVYRLGKDDRLENFSILVNENINAATFSNWQVRFHHPNSATHVEFMRRLKSMIVTKAEFKSFDSERLFKELFADIGRSDSVQATSKNTVTTALSDGQSSTDIEFLGMSLSMASWPKPTQVKLSSPVMKTCSLLCQCSVSYAKLSERAIWNTEAELVSFLLDMQRLGILQVAPAIDSSEPVITQQQGTVPSKTDRFSQLLKKFISSPKAQVK